MTNTRHILHNYTHNWSRIRILKMIYAADNVLLLNYRHEKCATVTSGMDVSQILYQLFLVLDVPILWYWYMIPSLTVALAIISMLQYFNIIARNNEQTLIEQTQCCFYFKLCQCTMITCADYMCHMCQYYVKYGYLQQRDNHKSLFYNMWLVR